jgi:hypothetical protein
MPLRRPAREPRWILLVIVCVLGNHPPDLAHSLAGSLACKMAFLGAYQRTDKQKEPQQHTR